MFTVFSVPQLRFQMCILLLLFFLKKDCVLLLGYRCFFSKAVYRVLHPFSNGLRQTDGGCSEKKSLRLLIRHVTHPIRKHIGGSAFVYDIPAAVL